VIGLQSQFQYGAGDFLQELTTPYGTSTFTTGDNGVERWIEATDPLGGTERLEYWVANAAMPSSDPAPVVPTGFSAHNAYLNYHDTIYWDKRASALYRGDYTKARVMHWLVLANTTQRQPLTVVDARGATTTYTCNTAGQVLTVTTPPAQGQS